MKLTVIALGNKMPNWVDSACNEYKKRFDQGFNLELKILKAQKRTPNSQVEQILSIEESRIREHIPNQASLIILDEHGKGVTTVELSELLTKWQQQNINPCFVIGGADGISANLKKEALMQIQLSKLTFPHGLARIILIEQLYRAITILQNHPYHRV